MKKIYTLLISVLPIATIAQSITVTTNDLPVVGNYYINAADSTYTAPIPAGGSSQSWNYATLQNLMQDTLGFISPSSTPYAGLFPLSNLAAHDPTSGTYIYFISDATGFYLNGAQSPLGIFNGFPLVYNPAEIYVPVPFTYNDTHNSFFRFVYSDTISGIPSVDSIRIIRHTNSNILADGYGSLTLPNGLHPNTLRIKNTMHEFDSIQTHSTILGWIPFLSTQSQTTNYRWLQNGGGSLILEINADSLGQTATSSSYLLTYGAVGINEIKAGVSDIVVYPNPAAAFVSFSFDKTTGKEAQLTIRNTLGEIVELYDAGKLNQLTIATNHLKNGIYFYTIADEKGKVSRGKFIVER
jgi:hypothetical protein